MPDEVAFYDAQYGSFETELYESIRREMVDEDIGQNGWLTAKEHDRMIEWAGLARGARLLDIACGSGGPALRAAERSGCEVVGVDVHRAGVEHATALAVSRGLADRARFLVADASASLPFDDASFDCVCCTDAINHLPERESVLREWARVLRPGGGIAYADPIIVTGPISADEMRTRSSIGFFLFVPAGFNESVIERVGLRLDQSEDATRSVADVAGAWRSARERRREQLVEIEGVDTFDGQQEFLRVTSALAEEGRLSRSWYFCRKPG